MPRSSTRFASRPRAFARTIASFKPTRYAAASRTPYVYSVIGPSSNSLGYMPVYTEHIENHDRDTDGNRRVGDVERPEMVRVPVHVDEVDHRSGGNPVEQVARGSADDEREPDARDQLMMREAGGIHADADQRGRRDHRDHDRLERKLGVVEDAECRAGV